MNPHANTPDPDRPTPPDNPRDTRFCRDCASYDCGHCLGNGDPVSGRDTCAYWRQR